MTDSMAKKVFDRYNNEKDLQDCPQSQLELRKTLNMYAKAAVNLYGAIKVKELADIYCRHNGSVIDPAGIRRLLLPLVLKYKKYCFYKESIVHKNAIKDFDYVTQMEAAHIGKTAYAPEKAEFLKYANPDYRDKEQEQAWQSIRELFSAAFPLSGTAIRCYDEIREKCEEDFNLKFIPETLKKYGLDSAPEELMVELLDRVYRAQDKTRLKIYNGHNWSELDDADDPEDQGEPAKRKVKMNELCPCGSGKTYKQCCHPIEEAGTSNLNTLDSMEFYEIWGGLVMFVYHELNKNAPGYTKALPPLTKQLLVSLREALCNNPGLIDIYLASADLDSVKTGILKSWRKHYKEARYIMVAYRSDFAVAVAESQPVAYGIKGVDCCFSAVARRKLPFVFKAVMLPFKNMIVTDTLIEIIDESDSAGMEEALHRYAENGFNKVVTRLK
ncbi:MAG: SEC-C domain-containing protein [Clostridiales bacterium]|nr:SEC-C domain-containing protein [Clostridiales bacterium]